MDPTIKNKINGSWLYKFLVLCGGNTVDAAVAVTVTEHEAAVDRM